VLLVAAGGMLARAQESPNPELDRLTKSAGKGDADAQYELGMRYFTGARNRPPDFAEALKWIHLAADQGNAKAQDRLGLMYYQGRGVPRDYNEAARWYLLAAQAGNEHAQRELAEMYHEGQGVPRDLQESKRWIKVVNERHPDRSALVARVGLAVAALGFIAFSVGLVHLQRGTLTGWKHLCVAIPVHAAGIALVLNTLNTYGFWIVFPHCSHNFLATACTQIADPHTRKIVNEIGDWAMVNLIFRFMAGIGLVLDGLAIWYVVYLCRLLFKRPRARTVTFQTPAVNRKV
jgi:hypothetical protein